MKQEEIETVLETLDQPDEEGVYLIVKLDPEIRDVVSVEELE